jgi:TPP-dependent trihydroxycyclohexane-1,2-dione (THcHDO) dehydratase
MQTESLLSIVVIYSVLAEMTNIIYLYPKMAVVLADNKKAGCATRLQFCSTCLFVGVFP